MAQTRLQQRRHSHKVLLHGRATSALGTTDPPNGSDPAAAAQGSHKALLHGLRLSLRWGYQLQLRRRSRALLHEPPHVHAWGVGQVASIQMIELIRPSSKTLTQRLAKDKMGTAFKGNADAYKSHSPCNHRLLSRKLLPHLVQALVCCDSLWDDLYLQIDENQ